MKKLELLIIPTLGPGPYLLYKALKHAYIKLNESDREKCIRKYKEAILDMGFDADEIISGQHELSDEDLERIARVYYLRNEGRNVFSDIFEGENDNE